MDIKEKAKRYAINAHRGLVRKGDPTKPEIIHPIDVAHILSEYNFDDNVIAAGYLHDVVEDTKYTLDDIRKEFGDDIASLVESATEPDKKLSWETRKKHTIEITKSLDLRHKAIICADKISNLEDLLIVSKIAGKYDFTPFRRGFEDQKWYNENVYQSLIVNENPNHPMFVRLKGLIDSIFEDKNIFDEDEKIIYQIKEINKLNYIVGDNKLNIDSESLVNIKNDLLKEINKRYR
jgi:hypothetical protein